MDSITNALQNGEAVTLVEGTTRIVDRIDALAETLREVAPEALTEWMARDPRHAESIDATAYALWVQGVDEDAAEHLARRIRGRVAEPWAAWYAEDNAWDDLAWTVDDLASLLKDVTGASVEGREGDGAALDLVPTNVAGDER